MKTPCFARTGTGLFIGDQGYYTGNSKRIPKDVLLEVIASEMPVAVCCLATDGRKYYFSGVNFRKVKIQQPFTSSPIP